jgi:DNA polymerase-3 subunit alpha
MKAVNLHHHTTFSHGDGYGTPLQHVLRAVELGYSAMALTEHGGVSSFFQAEKAAIRAGIKMIFGLEAYCGPTDPERRSAYKYHLTILASNQEGYRNLNKIVTQSYLDFYSKPTVSGANLLEHAGGIIALSGCSGSLLACNLLGGKGIPDKEIPDMGAAEDVIWRFKDIFGDRYFLEVQPFYELERTIAINTAYEELSRLTGVPIVFTNDVHYPRIEDATMQAILHAVHRGKHSVDDVMRSWNYEVPCTLPSSDNDLFYRLMKTGLSRKASIGAIEISAEIADRCNVTLPKAERLKYPISEEDMVPWTR